MEQMPSPVLRTAIGRFNVEQSMIPQTVAPEDLFVPETPGDPGSGLTTGILPG